MRTKIRSKFSLLFIALATMIAIPAAVALADIVANDLDATVDTVAENMPLQEGGAAETTKLYVINQNKKDGDTENNCNLSGTANLQLDVTSGDTNVATVSPASVTIEGCDATNGVTLTVTPVGEGSTTISVARKAGTDSSAPGTFNYDNATFNVNVAPPPNTPPDVSISGVTGGANYETNDVPTATCNVTDDEDGPSSFPATLSAITGGTPDLSAYGLGQQEATCSYTDQGPGDGLTATDSVIYNIVDTGKPVITDLGQPTPSSPNGLNGWYTSAVTNTFKAEDFNGTTPTPDVGAGFAGKTNPHNLTQSSGTSEGSAVKISSGTVSDVASNPATAIDSAAFKIDLSNPYNVQFTGGPAAGSSYDFGDTPAAPTCSAEDTVSGMPANGGCVVTGYSSAKGTHTLTATATDNAGRTATATRSYTVKPYTLNGFFSPVDMDSGTTIALNTVKGGSTVPLKFEVFKGTTELTNTSAIKIFTTKAVTCPGAEAAADEIEFLTTGSTSLRYDTTAGQFIQNWQTPKKVGCFDVTMETVDGSKITAHFKLR